MKSADGETATALGGGFWLNSNFPGQLQSEDVVVDMKNTPLFAILLLASMAFAAAPPSIPMAFYGVVTPTSGSLNGQTLSASLNGATVSAVIAPTNTYKCGASQCNYYLTVNPPVCLPPTRLSFR